MPGKQNIPGATIFRRTFLSGFIYSAGNQFISQEIDRRINGSFRFRSSFFEVDDFLFEGVGVALSPPDDYDQ